VSPDPPDAGAASRPPSPVGSGRGHRFAAPHMLLADTPELVRRRDATVLTVSGRHAVLVELNLAGRAGVTAATGRFLTNVRPHVSPRAGRRPAASRASLCLPALLAGPGGDPVSDVRSGLTMARRSLCNIIQAVSYALDAELALELHCRDARGSGAHQVGGPEPREVRPDHHQIDPSGGNRISMSPVSTDPPGRSI
jgi:hypothetical protein